MTVSTIIPTIGRATLYERAIPSVLAQTFTDWECIVVGDGVEITRAFDDPRIRVVSVSRGLREWKVGGVVAWNHGLTLAKGAWRSYLADDDAYLPHHHELLLGHADRGDFIYGQSRVRHPDGTLTDRVFGHTDEPEAHDLVQGSYIARASLDISGDPAIGSEAWDARMLRRLLPVARVHRIWAIVHDYYPAPEHREYHRLP